jgi:hypothetical protein
MRCLLVGCGLIALSLCCAGSAGATGLGYMTTQSSSAFPSDTSEPIKFDVHHVLAGGSSAGLLHELTVEVVDLHFYPPDEVEPNPTELLPLVLLGSDNGSEDTQGNRFPGPLGMINARLDTTPDDNFPSEVFFDFLIKANIEGKPANIINPEIIPNAGRYFDVLIDVEVHSNALHTARFALADDQPLMFVDPQVVPNESGVHVQGMILRTDGAPMQDLFSVEFHGHFVPEPISLALVGLSLLTLVSWRRKRLHNS